MPVRSLRWAIAGVAMGLTLAACESTKMAGRTQAPPGPGRLPRHLRATTSPRPTTAFGFASSGDTAFDTWRVQFAGKADTAGRSDAVIVAPCSTGLVPVEQTVQTQSFDNQAEFVKPIWDYASHGGVRRRASPTARRSWRRTRPSSTRSRTSYATPREIVAAIWGMESDLWLHHRQGRCAARPGEPGGDRPPQGLQRRRADARSCS